MNISELEPRMIWKNFYNLTQIPRPSKKEGKIIAYMKRFGESLRLPTFIDEVGNIIIKKPATPGMEKKKCVILQGHLDMVPQKNNDTKHDFENDPIKAYIDQEWVKAEGTTLGADNGMGVATIMAILESTDIQHGPLEALFTIDEETGMTGAFGLQPGLLNGQVLINLDSEDEGELYVGCAGGMNGNFKFKFKTAPVPNNSISYKITVKGLKGGHSGLDINLGRGNANKLLNRFLKYSSDHFNLHISEINGGGTRNAIPREAFAIITIPVSKEIQFIDYSNKYSKILQNELSEKEPNLNLTLEKNNLPSSIIDEKIQIKLLNALYGCPNGVIRMSDSMEHLVETSTNLATVKSENSHIIVQCLLRSSVDSAIEDLASMMRAVFELAEAEVSFDGKYPGWKPNMSSAILSVLKKTYHSMANKEPEIKAIHAGLECGILGGIYPGLDMISIGPTIRNPHSPDERVHIGSVASFWKFLTEALKNIDDK